jgi:hypothetical protein
LFLAVSFFPLAGYGGKDKGGESAIADQWFESQKKFYVDMGKTLGDTVRAGRVQLGEEGGWYRIAESEEIGEERGEKGEGRVIL